MWHCVLRALKTSRSCSRRQTSVFQYFGNFSTDPGSPAINFLCLYFICLKSPHMIQYYQLHNFRSGILLKSSEKWFELFKISGIIRFVVLELVVGSDEQNIVCKLIFLIIFQNIKARRRQSR